MVEVIQKKKVRIGIFLNRKEGSWQISPIQIILHKSEIKRCWLFLKYKSEVKMLCL